MADALLHIKDAYYFEVPKALYPHDYKSRTEFPDVWVQLDPQYQDWEFHRLYHKLQELAPQAAAESAVHHAWREWQHADHANFAKPLHVYLQEMHAANLAGFEAWKQNRLQKAGAIADPAEQKSALEAARELTFADYLDQPQVKQPEFVWFSRLMSSDQFAAEWNAAVAEVRAADTVSEWRKDASQPDWSPEKIAAYNHHLSGKILIPQPFGRLRNLYERESGLTISKFLIIEVAVSVVILLLFSWLGRKMASGEAPRGRLWNLLETFYVFIRDQVAEPAIGGGHDDHGDHAEHGHAADPAHAHGHDTQGAGGGTYVHGHGADALHPAAAHGGGHGHAHGHSPGETHVSDARRFTPLLCTIFFFILGCNLCGAIPWVGAPTGSFNVTLALALVTFTAVVIGGMQKFGFLGFFLNQIPGMDLPLPLAIVLKPMIFAIEMLGLLIKHAVLAVRLLANMVAGHLVILAFLAIAFGAEAALSFSQPDAQGWMWYVAAGLSIFGVVLINLLELFVAFLQAYVFTFLSALFIGASVHKH